MNKNKEPIRVMFYDDGFYSSTGYGRVARELTTRLAKDKNYEVTNINITDTTPLRVVDDVTLLPAFGIRMEAIKSGFLASIVNSISVTHPDVFIPICDAFYLERDGLSRIDFKSIKFMPYIPIDSNNIADGSDSIIKKADRLLVQSEFGKNELAKANYKSHVFRHGVDRDKFFPDDKRRQTIRQKFGIMDDVVTFLFIGRNSPRKQMHRLLRGFAKFVKSNPDIKVKLMLHGSNYDDVMKNIHTQIDREEEMFDVDLYDKIVFPYKDHTLGTGEVEDKIIDLYHAADWTVSMAQGEGCFVKGTNVLTDKGFQPIETVKPGTKVQSDDGKFNSVQAVSKKSYFKNLIQFTPAKHFEPIVCTKNHPILIQREKNDTRINKETVNETITTSDNITLGYIRAEDLTKDDYLAVPKVKLNKTQKCMTITPYIDMSKYNINYNIINYTKKSSLYKPIYNTIKIDKNLMRIFGLYISEGNITRKGDNIEGITFSFGTHKKSEFKLVSELKDAMKKTFGIEKFTERTFDRHRYQITFYSKIVGEFINTVCGVLSHYKHLPLMWKNFSKVNLQELKLYMNKGDGWLNPKTKQWSYTTVSRRLADDYYSMCIAIGNLPSIKDRKGFEAYQITDGLPHYTWKELNDYFLVKIKHLKLKKSVFTYVYNLEVKNNPSYCVNNYAVHNTGLMSLESFGCGIPTIYPQNSNWEEILGEQDIGHSGDDIYVRERGLDVESLETMSVGLGCNQPISSYNDLSIKLKKACQLVGTDAYKTLQTNCVNWANESADWDKIVQELKMHIKLVMTK